MEILARRELRRVPLPVTYSSIHETGVPRNEFVRLVASNVPRTPANDNRKFAFEIVLLLHASLDYRLLVSYQARGEANKQDRLFR